MNLCHSLTHSLTHSRTYSHTHINVPNSCLSLLIFKTIFHTSNQQSSSTLSHLAVYTQSQPLIMTFVCSHSNPCLTFILTLVFPTAIIILCRLLIHMYWSYTDIHYNYVRTHCHDNNMIALIITFVTTSAVYQLPFTTIFRNQVIHNQLTK